MAAVSLNGLATWAKTKWKYWSSEHTQQSEWMGWVECAILEIKSKFYTWIHKQHFSDFRSTIIWFCRLCSTWRTKIHYYSCSYVVIKCVDVDVAVIFDSTSSMMCTGGTDYPEAVVLITLLCNFQQQKVVMEWISTFYFDFKILCWWKTAQKNCPQTEMHAELLV